MIYNILLEVTVLSASGNVAVSIEQIEFANEYYANNYFDNVQVYEETPEIKVWRQVTKLY
ncbi:hypothetical protein FDI95_gp237 [Citrobacter phage CF1 ERZ-2017]|uniref:Uncharacterized protein n=1 Tax=Citrobacter phage CF1 ERZ-2017 TaxID=2267236 RepID=A0A2H4YGN3_9CAUD|nr:hypothetical protein FDI95_gp237 [Citrobacter phage CF1 ERZ-2017]AUE23096.1 hypothetical protein Cf1_00233 [Citrobacter phage CF1 ERZ-2017]